MQRVAVFLLGLLLLGVGYVGAQEGLAIDQYTVDGGGGESSGGDLVLRGTIGQPDAGVASDGDTLTLRGGFWNGTQSVPTAVGLVVSSAVPEGLGQRHPLPRLLTLVSILLVTTACYLIWRIKETI